MERLVIQTIRSFLRGVRRGSLAADVGSQRQKAAFPMSYDDAGIAALCHRLGEIAVAILRTTLSGNSTTPAISPTARYTRSGGRATGRQRAATAESI